MLTGKVVGNIVSTQKHSQLVGYKLLLVDVSPEMKNGKGGLLVAVDTQGAGAGETVLITTGSSARLALADNAAPVDAVIVGIVDRIEKG